MELTVFRRDTLTVTVDAVGDWSAWTWKADVREKPDDDADLIESFTAATPSFADGRTECVLTISAADMQAIPDTIKSGFFDVRVASGGVEQTLVAGRLTFVENVTP